MKTKMNEEIVQEQPVFQDKGKYRTRDIKLYRNRIERTLPNAFFGHHVKTTYLANITGIRRVKGNGVVLQNRMLTAEDSFCFSSRKAAQQFVGALNSLM